MNRVAVFVDAGYLFAQGSAILAGSKQPRHTLVLDEKTAITLLSDFAQKETSSELLRIYWYDGPSSKGETPQHRRLAESTNVKLRLGVLSSVGQQKGVDSLIVTDMIDLARNRAIGSAVLLSGDEDLRVGVQVAQTLGVRVHLLGIAPSRGSQSRLLIREADTLTEWDGSTVSQFLAVTPPTTLTTGSVSVSAAATVAAATAAPSVAKTDAVLLKETIHLFATGLQSPEVAAILNEWKTSSGIPREYDGRLLAMCRSAISRELNGIEKREMRAALLQELNNLSP